MTIIALLALLLTPGCSSCFEPVDADVDTDARHDADVDRDADVVYDADPDRSDAERDADDDDRDVGSPFDADCPEDPGDGGVRMDVVEVTSSREGKECGPGCRQVTLAAPVILGFAGAFRVSSRFLAYNADMDLAPIHVVDIGTSREFRIDAEPETHRSLPDVNENMLAYSTSERTDALDMTLWRYRVGECARYPLVTRTMTEIGRPMTDFSISGDLVAWYDSAVAAAGLWAMSLEGGEVIELTQDHCLCYGSPLLHGRTVVFEGWHTGPRNIWSVNVDTRVQTNLTNGDFDQFEPASDGEWVVWTDSRNDPSPSPYSARYNPDIYGMPLPSGEERAICTDPSTQVHPAVGDGLVAWEDFRNAEDPHGAWDRDANIDIYLYDLSTGREVQVTSDPGREIVPALDGRRVFYVADDADGEPAVFMVDLDEAGLL